jgi:hypothetical protein
VSLYIRDTFGDRHIVNSEQSQPGTSSGKGRVMTVCGWSVDWVDFKRITEASERPPMYLCGDCRSAINRLDGEAILRPTR